MTMLWRVLLGAYALFVLLVTMWPRPQQLGFGGIAEQVLTVLHALGVPPGFGVAQLEFTANIGMFVPLGLLLAWALPRGRSWLLLAPLAFSAVIEAVQGLLLPERVPSWLDVLANGLGGVIGLCVGWAVLRLVASRRRRRVKVVASGN